MTSWVGVIVIVYINIGPADILICAYFCFVGQDTYKKIIDIFPKGKMIASNMFQVEFMHYPKQQQCGIDILEQMEHYGEQEEKRCVN